MKQRKKTLYFDIKTEAKIRRVAYKLKKSESEVVRRLANRMTFKEMLIELREDMKHSEFINLDRM